MIRLLMTLLLLVLLIGCSSSTKKHERYYQTKLCNELGGEIEYRLQDRTRIDCLSDEYAIEVDFAKKWAESIGQSLFYAQMSGKKPAVGIIMDTEKDRRYLKRLNLIANKYKIKVFIIEKK